MPLESIGIFDILYSIAGWKLKAIKIFDLLVGGCLVRLLPRKPSRSVFVQPLNRILVIRPGGIGDAIFVLPFLQIIKKEIPGIAIDILCEARNAQIFESQRGSCDDVFCCDQLGSFRRIWQRQYDVVVDTEQWHYLSALVSFFIKNKMNIGFGTRPFRTKLFNKALPYLNNVYEIENFKKLFLPLCPAVSQINDIINSFSVDQETMQWAEREAPRQYVTLFLGASIVLRRFSHQQSMEIIHFALRKNFSIVLLGGQDVISQANEIIANMPEERIINFVGKVSLLQTAALIKKSAFFVGPDSGIMHLACAVGTPVIAVFGPGNLKKWSPKATKDKIITLNVECSPCTRFGYTVPTCHGTYKCMRDITIGKILNES